METKDLRQKMEAMIPVMKAFEEGKKIQFFSKLCREWMGVIGNPAWGLNIEYRVKPEPLVVYGNVYEYGQGWLYPTKKAALERATVGAIRKGVKFVEE